MNEVETVLILMILTVVLLGFGMTTTYDIGEKRGFLLGKQHAKNEKNRKERERRARKKLELLSQVQKKNKC